MQLWRELTYVCGLYVSSGCATSLGHYVHQRCSATWVAVRLRAKVRSSRDLKQSCT